MIGQVVIWGLVWHTYLQWRIFSFIVYGQLFRQGMREITHPQISMYVSVLCIPRFIYLYSSSVKLVNKRSSMASFTCMYLFFKGLQFQNDSNHHFHRVSGIQLHCIGTWYRLMLKVQVLGREEWHQNISTFYKSTFYLSIVLIRHVPCGLIQIRRTFYRHGHKPRGRSVAAEEQPWVERLWHEDRMVFSVLSVNVFIPYFTLKDEWDTQPAAHQKAPDKPHSIHQHVLQKYIFNSLSNVRLVTHCIWSILLDIHHFSLTVGMNGSLKY